MLTGIAGGIAALVIAIAILWALFQTWLKLLSAYANTILAIIFSPLQLMIDAVPGQGQFEGWLRTMLANLLAFPTVLAMILIGLILAKSNVNNPGGAIGFSPPLIGATNQQAMQALIGIGIILTIPKAVEIMQQVLKAPQNKWGTAWGEAVGAGMVGARGLGGAAMIPVRFKAGKAYEDWQRAEELKAKSAPPSAPYVPVPPPLMSWAGFGKALGAGKPKP
jgi:hypothetical protein